MNTIINDKKSPNANPPKIYINFDLVEMRGPFLVALSIKIL
jgi:hypothetical protein